jgi:hypothetical protein
MTVTLANGGKAEKRRELDFYPTPAEVTDAELESHIVSCGHLMEQAYAEGNREAAQNWLQAQNAAIRGRSPKQIALMEQRAGLAPCFFTEAGNAACERIMFFERKAAWAAYLAKKRELHLGCTI